MQLFELSNYSHLSDICDYVNGPNHSLWFWICAGNNYNGFELTFLIRSNITHMYNSILDPTTSQPSHAHPAACRYFKINKGNNV